MSDSPFFVIVATREGDQLFFDSETGYFEDQKWKATRYEWKEQAHRQYLKLSHMNDMQDKEDRYDSVAVWNWKDLP